MLLVYSGAQFDLSTFSLQDTCAPTRSKKLTNPLSFAHHAALKLYYGPSMKEKLTHTRVLPSSFARALHAKGLRLIQNYPYCFHYNPEFEFYRLASIYHAEETEESWSMQHSDYYSGSGPCMNVFLAKNADGEFLDKLDEHGRELWINAYRSLPGALRRELKHVTLILRDTNSVEASKDDIEEGLKREFSHLLQGIPRGSEIELSKSYRGLIAHISPEIDEDPVSSFNRSLRLDVQAAALEVLRTLQKRSRINLVFPDMKFTTDNLHRW